MPITHVTPDTSSEWARLCNALWPHHSAEDMLAEYSSGEFPHEYLYEENGRYIAFISLSMRHEYVEGKEDTRPIGYIEGIFVEEEYRKKGIAAKLVSFAKSFAKERGGYMLASDCEIENTASRSFHNRIGFKEVSVNVHFIMEIE